MTREEHLRDLALQVEGASKIGDFEEVKRLTDQITQLQKPQSFLESWGYPIGKEQPKNSNSFMDAWGFIPKERR